MTARSRPHTPGSSSFRGIDNTRRSREIDRSAWAGDGREVLVWQTQGTGYVVTPEIKFRTVFDGEPFFSYGVELQEGETLAEGDFPFVSAGVAQWGIIRSNVTDDERPVFYTSAVIWIAVDATKEYKLQWRFAFQGTVMRNREHIGEA